MKSRFIASLVAISALLASSTLLPAAEADPRIVKIRAGVENAMKFDVTSISVAPGESIKVVLTNASNLPKNVMGHNWILLTAGSDPVAFSNAATGDAATGYIPAKLKDKVIAFVSLLGPNETGEVTFKAPTQPGDYPFLCSFPAHCVVGMKGVLTVKK